MLARGHIQPHHDNLPRRRQRTHSPFKVSSQVKPKSSSVPARSEARARTVPTHTFGSDLIDTGSTASSTTIEEDGCERPSPGTLLTSPSDESLSSNNVLLNTEKHAPSPIQHDIATCDGEPISPFGILLPPDPPITFLPFITSKGHTFAISSEQPRVGAEDTRGHLEPRAANVPRRVNRTQKERERVRQRRFQELITGSRVWIAFNPACVGSDYNDNSVLQELDVEQKKKEPDWIWDSESKFGFSGVIRVKLGKIHGECRRKAVVRSQGYEEDESVEEMHLVIGREQTKACDDSGISALTDSQLKAAASFLIEHRQRRNDSGKVLITVPPSRPVESLSIALFALSLPSIAANTSVAFLTYHHSPSFFSQLRFLPGILELERSQAVDADVSNVTDPESDCTGTECQEDRNPRYSLIQLALWHLHDLIMPAGTNSDEGGGTGGGGGGGLTLEWRGALSLEGVERLENLTLS